MGGVVTSQAAEGRPEKVTKLVHPTAFLLGNGETLPSVAEKDPEAIILRDVFYGDCPDEVVERARMRLVPRPASAFVTPVSLGRGKDSAASPAT